MSRPVLRYHGGKWRLAPWIISNFPAHRIYVEPFGGGGSVLMQKPRTYAEVYNDLDREVVNVFRVLRDRQLASRLAKKLALTPFSRVEFEECYEKPSKRLSPVERARRTLIKSYMSFGSSGIHCARPKGMRTRASVWRPRPTTGFRANSDRSGTTPAHDWANYPSYLNGFCERLTGVVVECRPAVQVIQQHDRHDTLHYIDPPYPKITRGRVQGYKHELTDKQHRELADTLRACKGMVLISSYPSALYDELYPDWERIETPHMADGARPRTEVLYFNPAASAARPQPRLPMEAVNA